jgi:hypothetical protein
VQGRREWEAKPVSTPEQAYWSVLPQLLRLRGLKSMQALQWLQALQ